MKKNRLTFKRSTDFWAGFAVFGILANLSVMIFSNFMFEVKMVFMVLALTFSYLLYHLNSDSKIIKIAIRSLLFWKEPKKEIEEYSVAIDYPTLIKLVEDKRKLEEVERRIKEFEDEQKVDSILKFISDKNKGSKIWKN